MKCKHCGRKFHWCPNCGLDGLEAESEGYCCDECWKQHDPEGYLGYWEDWERDEDDNDALAN